MEIRGYLVKSDKTCARIDSLAQIGAAVAADTKLLWLDLVGDLTPEAEAELSRVLGWHPIVLENFHLASSRPKLINFDRYSQVTLHALNLSDSAGEMRTVEIDAVISKSYLITYHPHVIASMDETLEDFHQGRLASVGPDEVLYRIVDHLLEKYVPPVEGKKDLIAALEEETLYRPRADLLERIVVIRDETIELGLALAPQQVILAQLGSGVCRHVRPFIRPYFRDAENRLRNLIEEQASYKEILTNTLELYRSAMSARTNDAMRVLTAMSAMFLPLTFVTGLFGMNVRIPFSQYHEAFPWIIGGCIGSFMVMMVYFKAKDWF
jgi:magnesium transporter